MHLRVLVPQLLGAEGLLSQRGRAEREAARVRWLRQGTVCAEGWSRLPREAVVTVHVGGQKGPFRGSWLERKDEIEEDPTKENLSGFLPRTRLTGPGSLGRR